MYLLIYSNEKLVLGVVNKNLQRMLVENEVDHALVILLLHFYVIDSNP